MSDNSEKEKDLFKPDRRVQERPDPTDRRVRPRPTDSVRIRGLIWAAVVLLLFAAVVYFSWQQ